MIIRAQRFAVAVFVRMANTADTEDAVQDTFFQLIKTGTAFESEEHEKAWLNRTATNICKNVLRNWWRRRENLDDYVHLQVYVPFILTRTGSQ